MGTRSISTSSCLLTFWNNPCSEECLQDSPGRLVDYKVEPDRVPPVEEDALDQGHHGPGAVEAGADYANLQNFALGDSGFL